MSRDDLSAKLDAAQELLSFISLEELKKICSLEPYHVEMLYNCILSPSYKQPDRKIYKGTIIFYDNKIFELLEDATATSIAKIKYIPDNIEGEIKLNQNYNNCMNFELNPKWEWYIHYPINKTFYLKLLKLKIISEKYRYILTDRDYNDAFYNLMELAYENEKVTISYDFSKGCLCGMCHDYNITVTKDDKDTIISSDENHENLVRDLLQKDIQEELEK